MKKLLTMTLIVAIAAISNAASVNWKITAGNMYGQDGTSKFTGSFVLYATGGDLSSDLAVYTVNPVVNGAIANAAFTTETLTTGKSYDFYFVLTDGNKTFTSEAKTGSALETGATSLNFGNMASATQTASNWAAVPEPTSGLLLLLGVAGLALKRKRA